MDRKLVKKSVAFAVAAVLFVGLCLPVYTAEAFTYGGQIIINVVDRDPPEGGGNGGGDPWDGGGNAGGGNSGGDPWEGGDNDSTVVESPEPPQVDTPEEPAEPELDHIEEVEVPLAELPTTGGNNRTLTLAVSASLAMLGASLCTRFGKRGDSSR